MWCSKGLLDNFRYGKNAVILKSPVTTLKRFSPRSSQPFFRKPGRGGFFNKNRTIRSAGFQIQAKSSSVPEIQMMASCPPRLIHSDPVPSGWQAYHGNPNWFHCGFRGILEDRLPTPEDPQNECFYDIGGRLVDENHEYSGCRGTPNQYDSDDSPISHATIDRGGIVRSGAGAFIESTGHGITQSINRIGHEMSKALDWRNWMDLAR